MWAKKKKKEGEGGNVPSTLDIIAMQGFSGCRLGLCTRRVLRGGRRMGLWPPDMVSVVRAETGASRERGGGNS